MRRSIVAMAAVAMLVSLGAGPAGAHDERYKSRLTLKEPAFVVPTRGTFAYRGRITSERSQCEPGRTIALYRKQPGSPEVEVGNTETNAEGKYSITLEVNMAGKYYARASKGSYGGAGHDHVCLADESGKVDFPPEPRRPWKS